MSFLTIPADFPQVNAPKMSLVVERSHAGREFRVRDISQADYGRLQIQLAESEMPGLVACRSEFGPSKPLRGTRITGSLHVTSQTAVLVETLNALGATVRWCSSDAYSTQDHAAAALARDSASVFAWKGQSPQEYWWSVEKALDWGRESGPQLLIDDGGDLTFFIHEGVRIEEEHERLGRLPEIKSVENERSRIMFQVIRDVIKADPRRFRKIRESLVGVSELTSIGLRRLYQLQQNKALLFPAISVNEAITSRIESIYGSRQSFLNSFMRATDHVALAGKTAIVFGYGEVGRGVALGLQGIGAQVIVAEINPIRAFEAHMEGFSVRTVEDVVSKADIFVTATMNKNVITVQHMKQMKNNAIVLNVGQFENEIDFEGLKTSHGVQRVTIKPFIKDRFTFPDSNRGIFVLAEGRKLNFVSGSGSPSFLRSFSFTNHLMALVELWNERKSSNYERQVYVLPRHLEQKVARQHLSHLGARVSTLTSEQASYLNVPIEGPYGPRNCKIGL
ncbi:hypothetical protein V2J09_006864 [Rumex salicifolius]